MGEKEGGEAWVTKEAEGWHFIKINKNSFIGNETKARQTFLGSDIP